MTCTYCTRGHDPRDCKLPPADVKFARRYQWLRDRPLDAIHKGGVFAGKVPDNVVLNGEDLDAAIDREMQA